MSKYIVQGGKALSGEVSIRGAKNSSFKLMIAALLGDKPSKLFNLPQINDTSLTAGIIHKLGASTVPVGQHGIVIHPRGIKNHTVPFGAGKKSRASFMLAIPLLKHLGRASFPLPGGDKLGARPIDRTLEGLMCMGVQSTITDTIVTLSIPHGLQGIHYRFPKPTHTGTETLIMAGICATGSTVLENCAQEPEIDDLILFVQKMGASVKRHPTTPSTILIKGKNKLGGTTHSVIPDRNEAVTFACAALATRGRVNIMRIRPSDLTSFTSLAIEMGANIVIGEDEIEVGWEKPLKPVNIQTAPHPGFMTDWQAVFTVLLTQAVGTSSLVETVFPFRFQHLKLLEQMGARFKPFNPVNPPANFYSFNAESDRPEYFHGTKVYGPVKLVPQNICIDDLRAGATATIAALTAYGTSTINHTEYIERGYENLAARLSSLGANIVFVKK